MPRFNTEAFVDDIIARYGHLVDEANHTRGGLIDGLEAAGWTFLDNGAFAAVYLSPCKRYAARASRPDKGYEVYARIVQAHPKNLYFPVVHAHRVMPDGCMLTVMERLQHTSKGVGLGRAFKDDCNAYLATRMTTNLTSGKHRAEAVRLLCQTRYDDAHREDIYFDMKISNLMVRPNGHLVITDPYAPIF